MDEVIVYESSDRSLLGLLEEVLKKEKIPFLVKGLSDPGMAFLDAFQTYKVVVPQEHQKLAREIVEQVLGHSS